MNRYKFRQNKRIQISKKKYKKLDYRVSLIVRVICNKIDVLFIHETKKEQPITIDLYILCIKLVLLLLDFKTL